MPIILTEDEVVRILEGRFVSKIYYLEDPEKAVNGPVIGVPVEIGTVSEADAIKEARLNGRIMLIFRVGERNSGNPELGCGKCSRDHLVSGHARMYPLRPRRPTWPSGPSLFTIR